MFSFLEQLVEVFEAADIVSVEIDKHFLSTELHAFIDFGVFLPVQVYSEKR
jgi:hypothetical protein